MITKGKISNVLLVISIIVIFLMYFTRDTKTELYMDKINKLEHANDSLLQRSDSLNMVNVELTKEIKNITVLVDSVNKVLTKTENRIKIIQHEKIKIINRYSNLPADSVAIYLTNILNKNR